MRIDKYLKNARLIKRRTVAKSACEGGRVLLNGKEAKPGAVVREGDQITLLFGGHADTVEILKTPEHVRKEDAQDLYRLVETSDVKG